MIHFNHEHFQSSLTRWLWVLPSPPGRTFAPCQSAIWTHKRLASNLVLGGVLLHMMNHQQTPLFPFQDCSVFTLSSRRRASVAGLPRSGSWRLPTMNKVCFISVCSVVSVAWNWLTTSILVFPGPKSFLFVFWISGDSFLGLILTEWCNFDVLQASAHFLGPFWINEHFWHHVVLLNTSKVSAWDDCDIGSSIRCKVKLFAVDFDVCMPWVLEFQRVNWGCPPQLHSLSGVNRCDDTQYDTLFFFQSSESFLWAAHCCVASLHKTLSAFRPFGWTVLSSMRRTLTAARTFLASCVSGSLKSLRVVHFPLVLFPLFSWYPIDLCTDGIGLGHWLRLLPWSFVGSA